MDEFLHVISSSVCQKRRTVLISDKLVYRLYGQKIKSCFCKMQVILVPEGEACKTRSVKEFVEDRLLDLRITKKDALCALGGGAVLDLVGFVAATYMRGIDYYSIPTTLLAMVDACIGGKTAINHAKGKNLIGAFFPAKQVFTSAYFLESLHQSQINEAMSEVIKYGIVKDISIFDCLEADLFEVVEKCQAIKKSIVFEDPLDCSIRNTLNFGHTIAHAIEYLSEFRLSHGQAVSIGICLELEICKKFYGFCPKSHEFICHLLRSFDLLTTIDTIDLQAIVGQCLYDKKASNLAKFVITSKLGSCLPFDGSYLKELNKDQILEALCVK